MHPAWKEDRAKACFLYGRLLARNPATMQASTRFLEESATCFNEIHPHVRYAGSELKDEHFHNLGASEPLQG